MNQESDATQDVIVDGTHIILKCSNCNKELVDVWQTRKWGSGARLRAKCPYCNDYSFIEEIPNGFHLGGTKDALIKDIQTLDDYTLILTVKAENNV